MVPVEGDAAASSHDAVVCDAATMRKFIAAQQCPWCGRDGLRSLANHTVTAHGIYADELRDLAALAPGAPLCSPALSERHHDLAVEQDTTRWLHRPEVFFAAAASREAQYNDEQRERRVQQLNTIRPQAVEAMRRSRQQEKDDPDLAAARLLARSKARRIPREGAECGICGTWFCSVVPPGQDYRQRQYCSEGCLREARRRIRRRTWRRRRLEAMGYSATPETKI